VFSDERFPQVAADTVCRGDVIAIDIVLRCVWLLIVLVIVFCEMELRRF